MKEIGWEHHIVTRIPELWVVLSIEPVHISCANKSESVENHHRAEEVHKNTWVVQGSILHANKSAENRSHHTHLLVNHNPEVIYYAESSEHCVTAVLARTHFESSTDSSEQSTSWGHSLVNEVLEASCVGKQPWLESSWHINNYSIYKLFKNQRSKRFALVAPCIWFTTPLSLSNELPGGGFSLLGNYFTGLVLFCG